MTRTMAAFTKRIRNEGRQEVMAELEAAAYRIGAAEAKVDRLERE